MLLAAILLTVTSCDENKFLGEKPRSIYTAENSLVTVNDFQSAVNYVYNRARFVFAGMNADARLSMYYATDLSFCAVDENKLNKYAATMIPTCAQTSEMWYALYGIISSANVVLTRLEDAQIPNADKQTMRGEALFFRAFAYRMLAALYGGVPLVTEELTAARRDFVRATRTEIWTQAKTDLVEAASLLGNIDAVKDGKISKQMAQHLLAEVYIALGEYDNAVAQATAVIDYPAMGLMTERFGTKLDKPGDAYSDLFKTGNINRSSGNRETLWALQYDYLNPASVDDRWVSYVNASYHNITITVDGVTTTAFKGVTAEKGGRSTTWMRFTEYMMSGVWQEDAGDMRISEHNVVRDMRIDNEASPAFGKWFEADGYSGQADYRQWRPFFTIKAMPDEVPEDLWQKDSNGNPLLTAFGEHLVVNNAHSTFRDVYLFRLSETYLLRAEAQLGKNNREAAAADINVVRARVKATPATAAQVDIDYLLDERMRELFIEETRMVTLCRMGKLVERTRKYNSTYAGLGGVVMESSGTSMQDYHNLWPIPFAEIERNIGAVLEQNPGYTN